MRHTRNAHSRLRNRTFVARIVLAIATLVALVVGPAAARAQSAESTIQAAQYVLLLDDSESMRGNDPNRLTIFSARSMLALFDDRDEVGVVRLNAPSEREALAPIQPMRDVRSRLEAELGNDAKLAKYAGQSTPCSEALDAVRKQLNAARRKGTRQVLLYLTDGACSGGNFAIDPFLSGLESAKDNEFSFYVLKFKSRSVGNKKAPENFTPTLADLATRTGGITDDVTQDATGILAPFARALSRAQGFDALEITPTEPTIQAHAAAKRVRLLAIAEGEGKPLEIAFRGEAPSLLGEARAGTHQYETEKAYRYVALDYRPTISKVEVTVKNSGANWKLIAIPEYRLTLATTVRAGLCADAGESVQSVEVGHAACVETRLLNDSGQPVDAASLGGRVELAVGYVAPRKPLENLPLTPSSTRLAGTLETKDLERGYHVFHPTASIRFGSGSPFVLRGAAYTLNATSAAMNASITTWDAGSFVPGDSRTTDFTLSGNFESSEGTFKVSRPADFPACAKLTLSGVEEGGPIKLSDGQKYTLTLRIEPLCSLKSFARELRASVLLSAKGLPSVEIPLTAKLDAQLELPESITIDADRRSPVAVTVPIRGNHRGELVFNATLGAGASGWPTDDLTLGFAAASVDGTAPSDALASTASLSVAQDGTTKAGPRLWSRATACCGEGSFKTTLTLQVPGVDGESKTLPVVVRVGTGSWWDCHGVWVIRGVIVFGALVVFWMFRNVFKNSHFIKFYRDSRKKNVIQGLLPMRRDEDGLFPPKPLPPKWIPRMQMWLACGGLSTAFGRSHYLETMMVKAMDPDPSLKMLKCPLELVRQPLLPTKEAKAPLPKLPNDTGIFLKARIGGKARTYLRMPQGEPMITLKFRTGDEDYEAIEPDMTASEEQYVTISNLQEMPKMNGKKPARPETTISF